MTLSDSQEVAGDGLPEMDLTNFEEAESWPVQALPPLRTGTVSLQSGVVPVTLRVTWSQFPPRLLQSQKQARVSA